MSIFDYIAEGLNEAVAYKNGDHSMGRSMICVVYDESLPNKEATEKISDKGAEQNGRTQCEN